MLAAVLVIALAACVFVACNPKTEGNGDVTVTFNRNGLGEDVTLSGAPGKDISDSLPNPNSTQAYYFGGWYENAAFDGDPVQLPSALPAENKTYYARWYRKYSVSVLLEKADGTFEKSEELSFVGEVDKGEDSVTLTVETPTDFVDVNASKTFELNGRDCEFSLKYELSSVRLTFDFNGEGDNVIIDAKRGTDISQKLPSAADTEGYYFGGWFLDAAFSQTVDDMTVMPQTETTYFARWYRTYKVAAYVQNADHTAYEFSSEKSYQTNKGSENVTVKAADFDALASYLQPADTPFNVATKNESVCELRFDRDDVSVTYQIGEAGEDITDYNARGGDYTIGLAEDVLDELYANGFRFVCYSLDGQNPIDSAQVKSDEDLTVKVLFDKAYTERNGSDDLLWLPKGEAGKAYLYREGLGELAGTYSAQDGMFRIEIKYETETKTVLTGRAYEDGTFATQREHFDFKMYDSEKDDAAAGVTLSLDGLEGATLTIEDDFDGFVEALVYVDDELVKIMPDEQEFLNMYVPLGLPAGTFAGTYRTDPTYSDIALTLAVPMDGGSNYDLELHLQLASFENKDLSWSDVFVLRGEEFGIYSDESADIFLDGYGRAYYILSDGRYTVGRYGAFTVNEEERLPELPECVEFAAVFSTGSVYFEKPETMKPNEDGIPSANIYRYDGLYGAYHEFIDDEYAEPESYVFSGYGYAYKDGKRYTYSLENGDTMSTYLLRFISLYDAEGKFVMKALIDEAYGGYYKMGKDAMAYALTDLGSMTELIAIDGENAIYFYSDSQGGLYYTDGKIKELGKNDAGVMIYQYTDNYPVSEDDTFKFFMLETDGVISCYIENTPVYNGTFEGERGESITMDGFGNALYVAADGSVHEGRYLNFSEDGDGVMGFLCDNDNCSTQFLFSIEGGKFKPYVEEQTEALTLKMLGYEGNDLALYSGVEIKIDQNNAAKLTFADGNTTLLTVSGTVELYDAQNYYYLFKVSSIDGDDQLAEDWGVESDFIFMRSMVPVASETNEEGYEYVDVFMFSDGFDGEYDIDGYTLSLDGFGYGAFLGESGEYEVMTDGYDGHLRHYVIAFYDVQGYTYFFDIAPDGTLTLRGNEFIMDYYYLMTDEGPVDILLMPDGRGNLEIAVYLTEEPYAGLYSMAIGKYSVTRDGNLRAYDVEYTIWVVMEGFTQDECDMLNRYALSLKYLYGLIDEFDLTLFAMDSGAAYGYDYYFQVRDVDLYHAYVLDDLSVLILDGFYTAIYINSYGERIEDEYSVTKHLGTDEQDEEYIISIVRLESADLAFRVEERSAAHIGWEYGNYKLGDDVITLNGMSGEKSCVTYTSGDTYKEGAYTIDTNLMICTATFEDGSQLVFRVFVETGEYIICDDSIVGDFKCVDKEGAELGDSLHMDGLGRAVVTHEDGSWDRYDVETVSAGIFKLTNYYDDEDVLTVKLFLNNNTYRVSDGQMIEVDLPKFDFLSGAILDESKPLSIDSFDVVYIGDEAIGQVTSSENLDGLYMVLYHVTLNDGTETGFCKYNATKFDLGNIKFYTQYDKQTDLTLQPSDGKGADLVLSGYGMAKRSGNARYNAIYWFEGDTLVVGDMFAATAEGERKYIVDFEAKTYQMTAESINEDFVVVDGVLTEYKGVSSDIVLPTDMGIKEIGDNVFSAATLGRKIISIDLKNIVEIIGENAFAGKLSAPNLSSITGTENVKVIKDNAFYCTGISEIDLPKIVEIGYQGFYGSRSLGTITLGNDSTEWSDAGIGDRAFMGATNVTQGVVYFNTPHVPKLGAKAFNAGTKQRIINFKFKSAYDEAVDDSTDIGKTWKEFVDAANVTLVDLESQAAGASLEANTVDAYFEDKRK